MAPGMIRTLGIGSESKFRGRGIVAILQGSFEWKKSDFQLITIWRSTRLARLRYYMPSRVWRVSGLTSLLSAKVHQPQLIVFPSRLAERKPETRKLNAGRAIRPWHDGFFNGCVRILLSRFYLLVGS